MNESCKRRYVILFGEKLFSKNRVKAYLMVVVAHLVARATGEATTAALVAAVKKNNDDEKTSMHT